MTHVVVTVKNLDGQRTDLALPMEIPCQVLANAVAEALGLTVHAKQVYNLVHVAGKNKKKLMPEQTLQTAGVMFGHALELIVGEAPTVIAELKAAAELIDSNGVTYPLQNRMILIGRRTPTNPVDIDLTPLDAKRLTSRRHASIEKQKGRFVLIDENSANGTSLNGTPVPPVQPKALENGAGIEFGGSGGPVLTFLLKDEQNTPVE